MIEIIARVLATLFALLVISKTLLSFRQRKESLIMTLFWIVSWLAIIAITFYPTVLDQVFGKQRIGIGTLLGIGMVFLYFIIYRIYIKADRVEKQIAELISQLAVREIKKKR